MLTGFTIYRVGKEPERAVAELPADPGYLRLKAIINPLLGGAELEHVSVLHAGGRLDMFVDECGSINGLLRNEPATVIYRNNWLTQHPDTAPESIAAIYGTAILFDRRVWF